MGPLHHGGSGKWLNVKGALTLINEWLSDDLRKGVRRLAVGGMDIKSEKAVVKAGMHNKLNEVEPYAFVKGGVVSKSLMTVPVSRGIIFCFQINLNVPLLHRGAAEPDEPHDRVQALQQRSSGDVAKDASSESCRVARCERGD